MKIQFYVSRRLVTALALVGLMTMAVSARASIRISEDQMLERISKKVKTWDAADGACRKLGKGWNLPTRMEVNSLAIRGHFGLKLKASPDQDRFAYLSWGRLETPEATQKHLLHSSYLFSVADGDGENIEAVSLEQLQTQVEPMITETEGRLTNKHYATEEEDMAVQEQLKALYAELDVPLDEITDEKMAEVDLKIREVQMNRKPTKAELEAQLKMMREIQTATKDGVQPLCLKAASKAKGG